MGWHVDVGGWQSNGTIKMEGKILYVLVNIRGKHGTDVANGQQYFKVMGEHMWAAWVIYTQKNGEMISVSGH